MFLSSLGSNTLPLQVLHINHLSLMPAPPAKAGILLHHEVKLRLYVLYK